jgi:hypothetical protein
MLMAQNWDIRELSAATLKEKCIAWCMPILRPRRVHEQTVIAIMHSNLPTGNSAGCG